VFTLPDENKHVNYACHAAKWEFFYEFVTEYSKRNPVNCAPLECAFLDDDDCADQLPDIL
jgi:hypothetical protein